MVDLQADKLERTEACEEIDAIDKDSLIAELLSQNQLLRDELRSKEETLLVKHEELEIQAEELEIQAEELEVQNEELRTTNEALVKLTRSLKETEDHLVKAQKLANVGSWVWDLQSNRQVWSDERYRIFGLTPGELEPTYDVAMSFIHPDDLSKVEYALHVSITKSRPFDHEYRIVRKDGSVRFLHSVGSFHFNSSGEAVIMHGIVQDITEHKLAKDKLRLSELRYRSLFEHMLDGFAYCQMLYDDQGNPYDYIYLKVNNAFGHLTGLADVEGKKVTDVIPGVKVAYPELFQIFNRVARSGQPEKFEIELKPLSAWLSISVYSTEKDFFVMIFENITERRASERQIQASLKEKEVLLKEVNHRVKNNLQIVSSLLSLQSAHIHDERDLEMFKQSQNRVKSMAFFHEMLYKSKDLSKIDISEYLRNLTANLFISYNIDGSAIKLNMNISEVSLDIDSIIPLGLIINELVTNSIKHAFPDKRAGVILVELSRTDSQVTLLVSDNGIGLSRERDGGNTGSIGLQLVEALTKQLNGNLELDTSKGTVYKISFTNLR